MKIDIEEFKKVQKYLRDLKALDYRDIEIEGMTITEAHKDWWKYVGLNNRSYIQMLLEDDEDVDGLCNCNSCVENHLCKCATCGKGVERENNKLRKEK